MTGEGDEALERRRTVALAGHHGDADVARAGLDDADPGVRAVAIGALARLGALEPSHLTAAIGDPSPIVRQRAAEEAGRAPAAGREGVRLVPLLDDPDTTVVDAAAHALGELDPPEPGSVAALARLVRSSDEVVVRETAVAALGSLGDPSGLDAVLAATGDVATVRRRAVLALAAFEGPEVEAALWRLREDRDRPTRQAAEDLLEGWGG